MAQRGERKDLSIKACPRQHSHCCSPEGLADAKGTNRHTEQMERSSALWETQGLGRQIFHTRPSLPPWLPSLPWAQLTGMEGRRTNSSSGTHSPMEPLQPGMGCWVPKAAGSWWRSFPKGLWGSFSSCALQSCVCPPALPAEHSTALGSALPKPCRELGKQQCKPAWQSLPAPQSNPQMSTGQQTQEHRAIGTDLGGNVPNQEKNASC